MCNKQDVFMLSFFFIVHLEICTLEYTMLFVAKRYNEIFLKTLIIHCEKLKTDKYVKVILERRVGVVLIFNG